MTRPVIIAAGGTGGHIFPALALAAELRRRDQPALLVCDDRGSRYVGADVDHRRIHAASPSGGWRRRLAAVVKLGIGFAESVTLLRGIQPVAVAVFGGYASVPVGLAAGLLGLPLLVHEQNAVLGRANRLIARRAARLALTFAATTGVDIVPPGRRIVTGNPVRPEFDASPIAARPPDAGDRLNLLVIGGSQGARVLSDVVPAAFSRLSEAERARIDLTQQCRPEDQGRVADAYRAIGFFADLATFFDDIPKRLAAAQLVISRAGASSVAELLAVGRPAILVPYRHAADDHQRANAAAVAAAGASWLIDEGELDADTLAARLRECLAAPERLAEMAARAKALGRPDAAAALADAVLALAAPATERYHTEALA